MVFVISTILNRSLIIDDGDGEWSFSSLEWSVRLRSYPYTSLFTPKILKVYAHSRDVCIHTLTHRNSIRLCKVFLKPTHILVVTFFLFDKLRKNTWKFPNNFGIYGLGTMIDVFTRVLWAYTLIKRDIKSEIKTIGGSIISCVVLWSEMLRPSEWWEMPPCFKNMAHDRSQGD